MNICICLRRASDELLYSLQRERAEKQAQLDALRSTHAELMKNLENFSVHFPLSSGSGEGSAQHGYGQHAAWEADALGRLKEHLTDTGISPAECFINWNRAGNGLLVEKEFVSGVVETGIGMERDARRLFRHMLQQPQRSPEDPSIEQADFERIISEVQAPSATGLADIQSLQAELHKLSSKNSELVEEKDKWIRKLKERGSPHQTASQIDPANVEARIQELEAGYQAEIARLEGALAVAEMTNRDLSALKAAPTKRTQAETGKLTAQLPRTTRIVNMVIVEVHRVWLDDKFFSEEPTTFLSFDFYAHDTQNTYPATGRDVELGWWCEFVVDVDEVFMAYLDKEPLRLDLMERTSQSFRKLASASIGLKPLLDDTQISRRKVALLAADSHSIGNVEISIRFNQSLAPALHQMRTRQARSSAKRSPHDPLPAFLSGLTAPAKLRLSMLRVDNIRAPRDGHLPSPYIQYTWPSDDAEEPHMTSTADSTLNPAFKDSREWTIEGEAQLKALRGQDLELVVLDDKNVDDDENAVLGLGQLSMSSLMERQDTGEMRVALLLDDEPAGFLVISAQWLLPVQEPENISPRGQAASPSSTSAQAEGAPHTVGEDASKPGSKHHKIADSQPAKHEAGVSMEQKDAAVVAASKVSSGAHEAHADSAGTSDSKARAAPSAPRPDSDKGNVKDGQARQIDAQV
jgi:hypothetical protein